MLFAMILSVVRAGIILSDPTNSVVALVATSFHQATGKLTGTGLLQGTGLYGGSSTTCTGFQGRSWNIRFADTVSNYEQFLFSVKDKAASTSRSAPASYHHRMEMRHLVI